MEGSSRSAPADMPRGIRGFPDARSGAAEESCGCNHPQGVHVTAPSRVDGDLTLSTTHPAFSFNTAVELRPAAVAYPRDVREVVAAVRHARDHGLRVAPQ